MRVSLSALIRGIIMISPSDIFSGDTAAFRTKLYELWFENYDRASSGSALGSRLMNVFNLQFFHNLFHFYLPHVVWRYLWVCFTHLGDLFPLEAASSMSSSGS